MSKSNRKFRVNLACVGCPMFIDGACREKNVSDAGKWALIHVYPLHPENATCADCTDKFLCQKGGNPVLCSEEAEGIEWLCSVNGG